MIILSLVASSRPTALKYIASRRSPCCGLCIQSAPQQFVLFEIVNSQHQFEICPNGIQLQLQTLHVSSFCRLSKPKVREDQVPKQTDVLIVGGGVIGWAVAFWLRWTSKFSVTVVERDPTYACSASVLGLGSIRQQFSEPENIQMSLFSSEFLRNVKDYLTVLDNTQLDIDFNPQGCLILANESQAETLKQNFQLQSDLGAKVELLDRSMLSSRWPWLNVDDVELGCYGKCILSA
ncbi:unnamed protein product [Echinostoma caproni]|uniref:FAD-dependent oxidoreductase domain-containing protein 1 n=1 Tax=Echinostoma caproni TaxID=27848 RepID=A0A183B223_9TREM|nr:unnamed protein product [Echinostoma caproni]